MEWAPRAPPVPALLYCRANLLRCCAECRSWSTSVSFARELDLLMIAMPCDESARASSPTSKWLPTCLAWGSPRWTRWLVALSPGLLVACGQSTPDARALAHVPCRPEGIGVEARCTELRVFENRQTRQGRQLGLRIAVVPALAKSPRPDPLFILVGGPGQAATKDGAQVAAALGDVRRTRDIVLVDQRGTGGSNAL